MFIITAGMNVGKAVGFGLGLCLVCFGYVINKSKPNAIK